MARVDPQDLPNVTPSTSAPDQSLRVNANPAAFGAPIGEAVQKAGTAVTGAGKFWGQIQTDGNLNSANEEALGAVKKFTSLRGQDALDAQQETVATVDKIYNERRSQLSTPEQQLQFDQESRAFHQRVLDPQIYNHATQQGNEYATSVNTARSKSGMDILASLDPSDPNYDSASQVAIHMIVGGAVKNAHLHLGDNADPTAVQEYVRPYLQGALKTQAQVMAVKDPQGAADFIDKNRDIIGVDYPALSSQFRTRANDQVGMGAAEQALSGAATEVGKMPPAQAVVPAFQQATLEYESGNKNNVPVSVDGAHGPGQMLQATFDRFAQPGEKIDNPDDNRRVSQRYSQYLANLPNVQSDPARMAVGYFSGEGNIAPIGAAQPWIADKIDGKGTKTSDYVAAITGRMSTQGQMLAAKASAYDQVMDRQDLSQEAKQIAFRQINQRYTAAQIAAQASDASRKDQQNTSLRAYGDIIRDGKGADAPWHKDQSLTEEQVEHLDALALNTSKEALDGKPGDWGPKYDEVQQRIAHPEQPGGIRNQEQLLALQASGDLNPSGYKKASDFLKEVNAPHAEADARTEADFYKAARQLVTQEDPQFPSLKAEDADRKWIAARSALDSAIAKAKADPKGFTIQQLTDPNNANSIWKVLGEPGGLYLPSKNAKTAVAMNRDRAAGAQANAAAVDVAQIKTWQQAQAAYARGDLNPKQANDLVIAHPEWGITPMGGAAPQVPQGSN